MAIRTKRYESKGGRKVRAVKVTERNYTELLPWVLRNSTNVDPEKSESAAVVALGGDIRNQRLRLCLQGKGIRVARVGDYVVHNLNDDLSLSDATLIIFKGDDFEDKYKELKK